MTTKVSPMRGEIWDVDLNPTKGAELSKIHPVVVVGSDALRSLPLRLVAPITGWKDSFAGKISHVRIDPNESNGLSKCSAVDTLQLRGVAIERFKTKRGFLSIEEMEGIVCAIAAVVEYQ